MYARVEVVLPEAQNVLVIPITSILSAPYGDSVFVIEPKSADKTEKAALVVRQQFIRTGGVRGDYTTVQTGLQAGERIVSAGLFKLRNGMSVVEDNRLMPKNSESPHPPDN